MERRVLSCPPCRELVDVKTPAGFPVSEPDSQSVPVPSRKYFSGAAMLPKRVGLPSTSPAQSARSALLA
jgi:hypothetical protein